MQMRLAGFVELSTDLDPDTLRDVVVGAYRGSREGTVALALNDLPVRSVDRFLDPVVREQAGRFRGVWYLFAPPEDEMLLRQAARSPFVVATSERLCEALTSRGIPHMGREDGIRFLRSMLGAPQEGARERGPVATV